MKKKERVIHTWPVRLSKELILSPRLMVEAFLDPFSSLELEHELPYFDLLFVRMFGEFGVLCTWITSSIWLKGVPSFLQEYLLLQVRLLWSWLSLCLDWSSFTEFARFDFIDNFYENRTASLLKTPQKPYPKVIFRSRLMILKPWLLLNFSI